MKKQDVKKQDTDKQDFEEEQDVAQETEKKSERKPLSIGTKKLISLLLLIVIVVVLTLTVPKLFSGNQHIKEILTSSTLEKIINISELSTFQAVYNGIAKVMNKEKPDQLDYHVSYDAKVKAGFDLQQVKITMDEKTKKITITIPKIEITEVNVDISSLDYIFQNTNANTSTVSAQAYKACIADVTYECGKELAIYELAKQNAKNVMKALVSPFVQQLDSEYELEIY